MGLVPVLEGQLSCRLTPLLVRKELPDMRPGHQGRRRHRLTRGLWCMKFRIVRTPAALSELLKFALQDIESCKRTVNSSASRVVNVRRPDLRLSPCMIAYSTQKADRQGTSDIRQISATYSPPATGRPRAGCSCCSTLQRRGTAAPHGLRPRRLQPAVMCNRRLYVC